MSETRLTDDELKTIRAHVDAATPGPWSRVMPIGGRYWTIGIIDNHRARPLEGDDDWDLAERAPTYLRRLLNHVEGLEAELKYRGGYEAFVMCCARSGETPYSFEEYIANMKRE